jgi:uncharacterized protein
MTKTKKSIIVFFILTVSLSSVCYFIMLSMGTADLSVGALLMWCPGLSAIITKQIFDKKEKLFRFGKCKVKYIVMGILIPAAYLGVSYGVYWAINPSAFTGQVYSNSIGFMLFGILFTIITAMGEEIGWRGFLLPKMNELLSYWPTVIICGFIWSVWHYPLMISGLYQAGTPIYYQIPMFTLQTVLMTVILAYLRMHSDNLWPVILLHASHNYIDMLICGPLTKADNSAYYAGETGVLTAVILLIISWRIYRLSRK